MVKSPLDLEQDERGTYFMNSRDIRLLEHIPELFDTGIVSLKVEGRMKSEFYVATVANAYRKAIDEFEKFGEIKNKDILNEELETVAHRSYTDAYFDGDNLDTICQGKGQVAESYEFIALVLEYTQNYAIVEMRNRFKQGNEIEILSPYSKGQKFIIDEIYLEDGTQTDDAKLVQHHYKISVPFKVYPGDILRKEIL